MGNPNVWRYCNIKSLLFVCRTFRKLHGIYRSFPIQYRQFIVMMKLLVKHSNSLSFCLELSSRIGLAHAPPRDIKAAHSPLPSRRFFSSSKSVRQACLIYLYQPSWCIFMDRILSCTIIIVLLHLSFWLGLPFLDRMKSRAAFSFAAYYLRQSSHQAQASSFILQCPHELFFLQNGSWRKVDPRPEDILWRRQSCAILCHKLLLHFKVPHWSSHPLMRVLGAAIAVSNENEEGYRRSLHPCPSVWTSISPPQG